MAKKIKKVRASLCQACGIIIPRKSGEKPPLCKCGSKMKKTRMEEDIVNKGRIAVEELNTEEAHPKHPSRKNRIQRLLEKEVTPAVRLSNFRNYIYDRKGECDLMNWWEIVFPNEVYPSSDDVPYMLVQLRIQYQLEADRLAEQGIAPSSKFLLNYDAVMALDQNKLSPTLKKLVACYEQANKKRAERKALKEKSKSARNRIKEAVEEPDEEEVEEADV